MRAVTFAATQFACSWDRTANVAKAKELVRAAAADGAQVVLLQELFETPYFCIEHDPGYLALAEPLAGNSTIARFSALARAVFAMFRS